MIYSQQAVIRTCRVQVHHTPANALNMLICSVYAIGAVFYAHFHAI